MDFSGKMVFKKRNKVPTMNVESIQGYIKNGERLPVSTKELASCELYSQALAHSPNGRFVALWGDGKYTVYTTLNLRDKTFGSEDEVVWDNSTEE